MVDYQCQVSFELWRALGEPTMPYRLYKITSKQAKLVKWYEWLDYPPLSYMQLSRDRRKLVQKYRGW